MGLLAPASPWPRRPPPTSAGPTERSRLFGLLGAAFGVGFVAGPAIGALAALGGPRVPFFMAAGLAGAQHPRRLAPPARDPRRRPAGPARRDPARSPPSCGRAAPALSSRWPSRPWSPSAASRPPSPCSGRSDSGFGIASAAAVFTVVGLVIVVVQGGLVHPLVTRLGEVRHPARRAGANAAGLVLLALAHSWALAAPALVALTAGQGLVQTTMATALVGRADPRQPRGRSSGAQQSAAALARVLGPILLGGALLGSDASGSPYLVGGGPGRVARLRLLVVALRPTRETIRHTDMDVATGVRLLCR